MSKKTLGQVHILSLLRILVKFKAGAIMYYDIDHSDDHDTEEKPHDRVYWHLYRNPTRLIYNYNYNENSELFTVYKSGTCMAPYDFDTTTENINSLVKFELRWISYQQELYDAISDGSFFNGNRVDTRRW